MLTHIRHDQEPLPVNFLPDYSPATDFLTPQEESVEAAETATVDAAEEPIEQMPLPDSETSELLEAEEEPDLNALVHIEEMSEVMQEAWRRLRLSGPFRPEQYLSWEQGSEAPFPTLRVHDLEVVRVDDPFAQIRLETEERALGRAEEGDSAIVFPDAGGTSALSDTTPPALPDPTRYYRLDGTAMLERRRFLHLSLDLQLREAVWDERPPLTTASQTAAIESPMPSSFLVHELQQNRQVKSGRMEYFDGPVLSVLAFITSIEIEEKEAP